MANGLSEKQRNGAAALLVEDDLERARNRILAGVVQTREHEYEALLRARRVGLAKSLDNTAEGYDIRALYAACSADVLHSLVAKPVRNGRAGLETLAELSSRDVESLNALGNLIDWLVLVRRRQICHHLERYHLDLELLIIFCDEILRVVGAVEILALRVLARACMVAPDDEVCSTEVLANDRMPDCLAGAGHAHSEGKER